MCTTPAAPLKWLVRTKKTHQEHVSESAEVAEELLHRDLARVEHKVLPQVDVLLLHVLVQQVQLLVLLAGTFHEAVEAWR